MTKEKQTNKKRIWIIVAFAAVIAFSIHFYVVTNPEPQDGPMIQLARLDFKQPIDSAEASKITTFARHLEGVQNAYFNIKDGAFVFGYDVNSKQTSDNVIKQIIALNNYKAEKYVVDPKLLEGGCPVMDPNKFSYRFYIYYVKVRNLFS